MNFDDQKEVDKWHDRGPWKCDMKHDGDDWRIINCWTNKTKNIGPKGAPRVNYFDQAKRESARRNMEADKKKRKMEVEARMPLVDPPHPMQPPAPMVEAMARHGAHAQELANKNGRAYALVSADHNGRKVVHLRLPEDITKSETIIAVFHPDQISDELPNLHPDDFDYWMRVAGLVWYLARKYDVPLKEVEPKPMPFPDRAAVTAYVKDSRLAIAVRHRHRKTDGGDWLLPVGWSTLVSDLVHGLAVVKFQVDNDSDWRLAGRRDEYKQFKKQVNVDASDWLEQQGENTGE